MSDEIDPLNKLEGFCPYCKKLVHFSWCHTSEYSDKHIIGKYLGEYYIRNRTGTWAMAECPSCENIVLVKMEQVSDRYGLDKLKLVEIIPTPLPNPTDDRVKKEVKIDIDEAKICFSVKAYRACAIMCRRALQTICIDKGAKPDAKLDYQINQIYENGTITKNMMDWANSVRWVGNDAAHPGNEEVTHDDADNILKLTEQMANILYVTDSLSKEADKTHGKDTTINGVQNQH